MLWITLRKRFLETKMIIYFKNRKISVPVKETGFFSKALGLTFRTSQTKPLLFDFQREVYQRGALTSWFVFFPFLAVWLDKNNRVLEFKIISPFTLKILPKKPFRRIVEVPLNAKNKKIIGFFVGKIRNI